MLTLRLLQAYVFLSTLELLSERLIGIDTALKPYRIAAILTGAVVLVGIGNRVWQPDYYDARFFMIFSIGCSLSCVWLILGRSEFGYVSRQFVFVLIPWTMYYCLKACVKSPADLAAVVRAFVLGAMVNAAYAVYEVTFLKNTGRPSGLSGAAPELGLHCGLALAFVLFPSGASSHRVGASLYRCAQGALLCFAVIASGTRAVWVGLAVSMVALSWIILRSPSQRIIVRKVIVPAILVLVCALAYAVQTGSGDGADDSDESLKERISFDGSLQNGSGRLEIWPHAVDVLSSYYFLGGGLAGFVQSTVKWTAQTRTMRPEDIEHGVAAHNVLLEVLGDYGPVALWLLLICLARLLDYFARRSAAAEAVSASHGILFAFIVLIVCGLFRDMFAIQDFWIVLAFVSLAARFEPEPRRVAAMAWLM